MIGSTSEHAAARIRLLPSERFPEAPFEAGTWEEPVDLPRLGAGRIHVWYSRVDGPARIAASLGYLLSQPELARAASIKIPAARHRYAANRGLLRLILSHYPRGNSEAEIIIRKGGKPRLKEEENGLSPLLFNLSHSREWLAVALGREDELGIDLEFIDPELDYAATANGSFSEVEKCELGAVKESGRRSEFFRIWTCMEAVLKAEGTGLAGSPAGIQLVRTREGLYGRSTLPPDADIRRAWALRTWKPREDFHCSLASERAIAQLSFLAIEARCP